MLYFYLTKEIVKLSYFDVYDDEGKLGNCHAIF